MIRYISVNHIKNYLLGNIDKAELERCLEEYSMSGFDCLRNDMVYNDMGYMKGMKVEIDTRPLHG